MPSGKYKSRTYRRTHKKLPGGETVKKYSKRKPKVSKCTSCGAPLKGIPRERPVKMRNLPKSKKKVERPFGGYLCTKCSKRKFKDEARQE